MKKTHNKDLRFTKEDWAGNPIDEQDRYMNLDGPSARGFKEVFQWKSRKNKYADQKKGQKSNVKVLKESGFLKTTENHFTWLGHATFLFQFDGLKVITDPVLYNIWPLQRFTDLPCHPEELVDIDIILLSHNHRDHADKKSMIKVASQNPNAIIYTGLGIGKLLTGWGIKNKIVEAGWYQEYPEIVSHLTLEYLPSKHWNRRFLHDLNEMLWGSFMIQYKDLTIYFGGDSGLGTHFKELSNAYDIDVSILGIGAYEPTWFMKASHTSPQDALQAKEELNSNFMVPMHYGTFDLSDEPIYNPKDVLKALSKEKKDVIIPEIGEIKPLRIFFQ